MSQPLSRRVPLDTGLESHVLEWGGDDASLDHTVVLVHGFLDIAWGWQATVDAGLAGKYHVVAPDARGHGDSDRVGAGGYYHFFDYLADLHSIVTQLGRERVSLVGHSMGGSITSYYTGTYPDRIHRLALLEGVGPPEMNSTGPQRVRLWLQHWKHTRTRQPKLYPTLEAAAERLRKNDSLLDQPLSLFLAEQGTIADGGGRRFKHDPVHLTRGPYPFLVDAAMEFWNAVTCPVLIVEGSESSFRHMGDEARRRHAGFADHRTEVIDGAAHMMHRHQPEVLANLLVDFLGD